jgi:VWFA-related protein
MPTFLTAITLLGLTVVTAAQAPATAALKVKTRIVTIDVVVTDKQGKPVKNLQAADFALAENGAPQRIAHFEAHTGLFMEDAAKLPPMPKLEPNIFTNYSPAPPNSALNVLLLDELNTHDKFNNKRMDQSAVRQQVLKYLATSHPGARMAIFELNGDLQLLQGFTSDPEILRAALKNPKHPPQTSMMIDNPACGNTDTITTDWTRPIRLDDPDLGLKSAMDECRQAELRRRSLSTLNAMAALARYMGALPGRKNLLWFSTSFPIPANKEDVSDELHKTMALFAKNQVAVYPIAAGGLMIAGPRIMDKLDSENLTAEKMAEDTGGKVFANTNDMAGAVEQAVDDGSNYYTLTYSPSNHDWKGEFRKVEVKLAQSGYTLAYRRGYYADDLDKPTRKPEAIADKTPATDAATDPAKKALQAAMEYGSPQPADIILKAQVDPATATLENAVAHGNSLAPKISGPFERYVISIVALPSALTFTRTAAGKMHMGAQLATRVYSADGTLINIAGFKVEGELDDARYQSILANGMKFRQEISVPLKRESFLRIGVEDLATSRVGVVEIPVASVPKSKPQPSLIPAAQK